MKTAKILKLAVLYTAAACMAGAVACNDDTSDDSHFIYFSTTQPYTRIGGMECRIDNLTGEITNTEDFPSDTDFSAMTVWFVTNHGNEGVFVNGVKQRSGVSVNDFTNPVEYEIRTDRETRKYTVRFSASATCKTQAGVRLEGYSELVASIGNDRSEWLSPAVRMSEVEFTTKEVSYKVTETDPPLVIAPRSLRLCLFEIDMTSPSVAIRTTLPDNGDEWGMQNMVAQAEALENSGLHVLGAVNGDYFDWNGGAGTGEPEGIVCRDGHYFKESFDDPSAGRFFGIRTDGRAAIGTYDQFLIVKDKLRNAVGGRQVVITADGRVSGLDKDASTSNRTLVGMSSLDLKTVYLATITDAGGGSTGVTLYEAAGCLLRFGVGHALNLDGGGSSTFVVRRDDGFAALNRPGGTLRNVGNGLAIIGSDN